MPPSDAPPAHRYSEIRFCPRCGSGYRPQDFHAADVLFLCGSCGFDYYQNPLPAAVVALRHPVRTDELLMLKRRTPPNVGLWCVPGGFIRYGEAPDAAAAREVREEVGIEADIGPVLRAGLVDYPYRGRRLCILELAYVAVPRGPLPAEGFTTPEASETAWRPVAELLREPGMLAFPEQHEVLRAFGALFDAGR